MAAYTQFYGLAMFDFGDDLGSPVNVQLEIDRFVVIDKQLYGMYQIFGDGVISGWDVTDGGGLSVDVQPGLGIINSLACESDFAETVDNLSPNTFYSIYVYIDNNTVVDSEVAFTATTGVVGDGALLLANVTTGGAAISNIDTTVQTLVGFKAIIQELIAKHRHDGISAPKIDLTDEVQGLLPNDHLEDLDASKIVSGLLPTNVVPTLDHANLKNIGRFSHSGLDTIVQTLQRGNLAFFGEVVASNMLKNILSNKYINPEADTRFTNELAVIPGISPDAIIDFDNSDAIISFNNNCISGIPAVGLDDVEGGGGGTSLNQLQIINIAWITDSDFEQANIISNLLIDDGVELNNDGTFNLTIDNFEGSGLSGVHAGASDTLYVASTNDDNNAVVTYDNSSEQGSLAGFFNINSTTAGVFTRQFTQIQDWSQYGSLVINVKNYNATHAAVYMTLTSRSGGNLIKYTLLAKDEITTVSNAINNGYATKTFDISALTRNDITGFVITTDDIVSSNEAFYIDNIYLKNQTILLPQGDLRFRYNTTAAVIFNAVEYVATIPAGTDLRVRVRVANTLEDLETATFGPLLSSGQAFSINGVYIEIDIVFISDANRLYTPKLSQLFLTLLVPSTESGLVIGPDDWSNGTFDNIQVDLTDSANPLDLIYRNVDDIYFAINNSVNEMDPQLNPVVGLTGSLLPITPGQGYNSFANQTYGRGLTAPKAVRRLENGNYLVCDTENDRVVEMTENGTMVRGFASHNIDYTKDASLNISTGATAVAGPTVMVSANYNPRLGTLYVAFSTYVNISTYDLTRVTLYWNNYQNNLNLNNSTETIITLLGIPATNLSPGSTSTAGSYERVLAVILDTSQQAALSSITSQMYIQITNDPNFEPIEVFYGDYMYFGSLGIYHPINVIMPSENEWFLLNSRFSTDQPNPATIDPNYGSSPTIYSGIRFLLTAGQYPDNNLNAAPYGLDGTFQLLDFSDVTLGSVVVLPGTKLMYAGLLNLSSTGSSSSGSSTSTTATIAQTLTNYVGAVLIVDGNTGAVAFKYESPDGLYPTDCLVDEDGFYTISESSLYPQAGRIIKIDSLGNIVFVTPYGDFTQINDIRLVSNNHLLVST